MRWVIFDLDGTLIESEQIWQAVRRDFVIEHGGRWHDDAQRTMMGMRTAEWSQYVHDELEVSLPPEEIASRVVDGVAQALKKRVPVLPGAQLALADLAAAFPLGLATSSALAVARTALEETGWASYFRVVVSADDVPRGKPAPDVYRRALDLLGADAACTAAIEDSANGIRSAHNAGLAVIAVPNREFPPERDALALASRVLGSVADLKSSAVREVLNSERCC